MKRVRLIHWDVELAQPGILLLQEAGYSVEFEQFSNLVRSEIRGVPPDVLVIDLSRLPSQGRDLGLNFRKHTGTRYVPIVFVGGKASKISDVQRFLPDAFYTDWEDIVTDLPEAISNPPSDPIVPDSVTAGYSGTPLPKKLGIKKDSTLLLLGAPRDFSSTLGDLPENVVIQRELITDPDVTLWFVKSTDELTEGVRVIGEAAGKNRLWVVWPKKTSGIRSDLTQNVVRQSGLENGLVDYKIATINETWSGLCFTRRRKG